LSGTAGVRRRLHARDFFAQVNAMYFDAARDLHNAQRKKFWASRHRWATPAPVAYVSLSGEISFQATERLTRQIEAAGDETPLHVEIESLGGSVHAGFDCYHALAGHPAPVTTAVCGNCYSAAVLPYLAGDTRIASSSATFFIHSCSQYQSGSARALTLRSDAVELEALDAEIRLLIAARTRNYGGVWLQRDMENETLLNGHEAHLKSLVTHLVD
jgi:ATP-dependent protease ClpP protease subunit